MSSISRGRTRPHSVVLALAALLALSTLLVAACASPGTTGRSPAPTPTAPSSTAAPTIREFPLLTTDYTPGAIAAGTDGALWFIEVSTGGPGGRIGRITTAGAITEYPLLKLPQFGGQFIIRRRPVLG